MYKVLNKDFDFKAEETAVNKSIINSLNLYKAYGPHGDNDLFSTMPENVSALIFNYSNELKGDLSDFEDKYKLLRNEFHSKLYSNAVYLYTQSLSDIINEDEPDENHFEFLYPRLRGSAEGYAEDSVVYEPILYIINKKALSKNFQNLFINFDKTISELITVFNNSIINYLDSKNYTLNESLFLSNGYEHVIMYNKNSDLFSYYSDNKYITETSYIFWTKYNRECAGALKKYYG